MQYKVLISDIDSRKAFDIYNIFRKKTTFDLVVTSEPNKINFFLKRAITNHIETLRQDDYEFFKHDLDAICAKTQGYKIIYFPVSDKCTLLFYRYINENPSHPFQYLLPPESTYKLCLDKNFFNDFCLKNGFLIPNIYTVEEIKKPNFCLFPLIAKPKTGSGSSGIFFIENQDELVKLADINVNNYLFQQRINSIEVTGAFFLFYNNNVVNYYGHRRLRTSPSTGGVTVCSVTENNEELKKIGEQLLKKLDFEGLAMIEFLKDETDNQYKIIELNPRSWGSYLLGEFAGYNFSQQYVELANKGTKITQNDDQRTQKKHFVKWLVPYEIINFLRGKISFKTLISNENTAFINITFANKVAMFFFICANFLDIKKVINKITR